MNMIGISVHPWAWFENIFSQLDDEVSYHDFCDYVSPETHCESLILNLPRSPLLATKEFQQNLEAVEASKVVNISPDYAFYIWGILSHRYDRTLDLFKTHRYSS